MHVVEGWVVVECGRADIRRVMFLGDRRERCGAREYVVVVVGQSLARSSDEQQWQQRRPAEDQTSEGVLYLRRMQKVKQTLKVDGALKIKSFRRCGRFGLGEFNCTRSLGKLAMRAGAEQSQRRAGAMVIVM